MPPKKTVKQSLIPAGHTFANPRTFISEKAWALTLEMLERADNRLPDLFNLYIYNEFFNYAVLDLVDTALSKLHARIGKKDWNEAYIQDMALMVFVARESAWVGCDDGERVSLTDKVLGASLITILRALKKVAADWGEGMSKMGSSDYYLVCKGIGRRLFHDKSDAEKSKEAKMVEEWLKTLSREDRAAVKKRAEELAEDEEEEVEIKKPWYGDEKDGDEGRKDTDYTLSRMWKEYRSYLAGTPSGPMKGLHCWDLDEWTETEKAPFSFENYK